MLTHRPAWIILSGPLAGNADARPGSPQRGGLLLAIAGFHGNKREEGEGRWLKVSERAGRSVFAGVLREVHFVKMRDMEEISSPQRRAALGFILNQHRHVTAWQS